MANKGPDPIIAFMQENVRQQQETARENIRVLQQAQASQMKPHEVFAMMRDASSGTDQVLKSAVNVYTDLFGVAREMFGQFAGMQGGGESPLIRVAESMGSRLSNLAERYMGGEQAKAIAQANAQKEVARAYQAQTQQVSMPDQVPQPTPATSAPAQIPSGGLHGVTAPPASNGATAPAAAAPVPKASGPKRHGRTDEEWFGPAIEDVKKLRAGVSVFVDAVKKHYTDGTEPKEGEELPGLSAERAMQFVIQAGGYLEANQIPVKAFDALLKEGQFADFLDVLLPDAPQAYRDDCFAVLDETFGDDDEEEAAPGPAPGHMQASPPAN